MALRLQRLRQPAHAPAGPPQRRSRIPAGRWFDQRLEIRQQGRVPRFREGRLVWGFSCQAGYLCLTLTVAAQREDVATGCLKMPISYCQS